MRAREIDDLKRVFRGGCDYSEPDDVEAFHDLIDRIMVLGGDPWSDDRDDDPSDDVTEDEDGDEETFH